ncbi:MAG: hypothetical protein AAF331_12255 [Pseudomonadota bacterium]
MTKTLLTAALLIASAAAANAQPLPAPPTAKYTAPAVSTCATQTLQVYFPAGQTALTAASQAMLAEAQQTLANCIIGPVSIAAVAADAPSPHMAEQLAVARLDTVTSALDQHSLSGAALETQIDVAAPAKYTAPKDRKVEIRLSAWAPEIG